MDLYKDMPVNDNRARYTSLATIIVASYAVGLSRGLMDAQTRELTGWSIALNTAVPVTGAVGTAAIADHNDQVAIRRGCYEVDENRSLADRLTVQAILGTVLGGGVTALFTTAGYLQGRFVNNQEIFEQLSSLF
tara:strand:+ start:385 stop:786 length:402 start_codon:yes stop_codon:yes gene_type:complete